LVFLVLAGCFATLQLVGAFFLVDPPNTAERLEIRAEDEPMLANEDEGEDEDEEIDSSVEIRDVLRSPTFYALFFSLACSATWVNITSAFYKTFGQTFIHDDFFLAMVSSLSSVCNALSRVVWGSIADRLSYQVAMAIVHRQYNGRLSDVVTAAHSVLGQGWFLALGLRNVLLRWRYFFSDAGRDAQVFRQSSLWHQLRTYSNSTVIRGHYFCNPISVFSFGLGLQWDVSAGRMLLIYHVHFDRHFTINPTWTW